MKGAFGLQSIVAATVGQTPVRGGGAPPVEQIVPARHSTQRHQQNFYPGQQPHGRHRQALAQPPRVGQAEEVAVLVGHDAVDVALEVAEHGEPNFGPEGVPLVQGPVVGQRVVVEEHSRGDVKGDEHINRVMFVRRQHEEHSEHVQHPRTDVDVVQPPRGVYRKINQEIIKLAK